MTAPAPAHPARPAPKFFWEDFPAGTVRQFGATPVTREAVLEARPMVSRPAVGLVRCQWAVHNQDGVAVLTMAGWGMFRRRAAAVPGEVPSAAPGGAPAAG
jgi:hypothetical protein